MSPVDLACWDIEIAAGVLAEEIKAARTPTDALHIRRRVAELIVVLQDIENAALKQAGYL